MLQECNLEDFGGGLAQGRVKARGVGASARAQAPSKTVRAETREANARFLCACSMRMRECVIFKLLRAAL